VTALQDASDVHHVVNLAGKIAAGSRSTMDGLFGRVHRMTAGMDRDMCRAVIAVLAAAQPPRHDVRAALSWVPRWGDVIQDGGVLDLAADLYAASRAGDDFASLHALTADLPLPTCPAVIAALAAALPVRTKLVDALRWARAYPALAGAS
jgi:hypothetical protein